MKFHSSGKSDIARKLRQKGRSYVSISHDLGVSEKTISRWCNDIYSSNIAFTKAQGEREQIRFKAAEEIKSVEIDKQTAKIFASLLYWAEGGKYPQTAAVSFCNSDPIMVRFFLKLLRYAFNLDEDKFRIHLQMHTTHDKNEIFNYWSELLDIPVDKFWKPTITKPTSKMKRRDYMGTCTLRYHDYKILLRLTSIYECISHGKVAEWPKAAHC